MLKILFIFIFSFVIQGCYSFNDIYGTTPNTKDIIIPNTFKKVVHEGLEGYEKKANNNKILVIFGGKSFDIKELLPFITNLDINIITFNYPNYGDSKKIDTFELQQFNDYVKDVENYLSLHYKNHDIFIMGYSLGSWASSSLNDRLKNNTHLKKLFLIAPLTTIEEFLKDKIEFSPDLKTLNFYNIYDNLKNKKNIILITLKNDTINTNDITKNIIHFCHNKSNNCNVYDTQLKEDIHHNIGYKSKELNDLFIHYLEKN